MVKLKGSSSDTNCRAVEDKMLETERLRDEFYGVNKKQEDLVRHSNYLDAG